MCGGSGKTLVATLELAVLLKIARWSSSVDPHLVPAERRRATHTLLGDARLAWQLPSSQGRLQQGIAMRSLNDARSCPKHVRSELPCTGPG